MILAGGLAACAFTGTATRDMAALTERLDTKEGPLAYRVLSDNADAAFKVVVVEGDGFAYIEAGRPSSDPTPRNPVGLDVAEAAAAQGLPVSYLARPGQWGTARDYMPRDWTLRRFDGDMIDAQAGAVAGLGGFSKVLVVGYSGGAAVVRAAAARMQNMIGVISIAGNLYPNVTNAYHGLPPFVDIENTLRVGDAFAPYIPVLVVRGSDDRIIPPPSEPDTACRTTLVVEASHAKLNNGQPWASIWPQIYAAWLAVQARCSGVALR